MAMGDIIRLENRNYLAFFHDNDRIFNPKNQKSHLFFEVFQTISLDGGLTWSQPVIDAHHPSTDLCEPSLLRSPDGNQLAMLLRENSRRSNSFFTFSSDEGQIWSTTS